MCIERARLQPGRHLRRMRMRKAVHPAAAYLEGRQIHAFGHAQSARPLRAEQTLVSGEAQHRNAKCFHVHLKHPGGLRCIQHKVQPVFPAECADFGQIKHIAGHIGHMRAHNALRIRAQGGGKAFILDAAPSIRRQHGQRRA